MPASPRRARRSTPGRLGDECDGRRRSTVGHFLRKKIPGRPTASCCARSFSWRVRVRAVATTKLGHTPPPRKRVPSTLAASRFNLRRLWHTGSSAFADDESGGCGRSHAQHSPLSPENSFNSRRSLAFRRPRNRPRCRGGQGGGGKEAHARPRPRRLGVGRAEIEPADAGERDPPAHSAGFERDIEVAVDSRRVPIRSAAVGSPKSRHGRSDRGGQGPVCRAGGDDSYSRTITQPIGTSAGFSGIFGGFQAKSMKKAAPCLVSSEETASRCAFSNSGSQALA